MIHLAYIQKITFFFEKNKKIKLKIAELYFRLSGRWTEMKQRKELMFDSREKQKKTTLYFDGQIGSPSPWISMLVLCRDVSFS